MVNHKNGLLGINCEAPHIDEGTMARCESPQSGPSGVCMSYDSFLQSTIPKTHVVVMFEGWNAPWEEEGGKPVPKNAKTTINAIRRGVINEFNLAQAYKTSIKDDSLAIEAYATDTDDDVKDLAIGFIEKNHTDSGVVVIYGYSWGGDTAIELAKDLDEKQINVDLLITIDAALGPFNGPAVRDRTITGNVKLNLNHYTSTPKSRIGSRGMPNRAKDSRKTTVKNIVHQGPSHGQMDEVTAGASINYISDTIIGERVCE